MDDICEEFIIHCPDCDFAVVVKECEDGQCQCGKRYKWKIMGDLLVMDWLKTLSIVE